MRSWAAVLVVGLLGAAVSRSTVAGFSGSTTNPGNTFSASATGASSGASIGEALVGSWVAPSASYSSTVLADNPLAYWKVDETTATATMADSGPGGYHGTYTASGPARGLPGATGRTALGWSPGSAALSVPHAPALNLSGSFSVELWARLDTPSAMGFRVLAQKGDGDAACIDATCAQGNGWSLVYDNSGMAGSVTFYRSGLRVETVPVLASAGYHHVVVTHDGTTTTVYLDGVANASGALTVATATTGPLLFGTTAVLSGETLMLDEPALYAGALSADRVRAHYEAGRSFTVDPCAQYRVYATVTDQANPPLGIVDVRADLGAITGGSSNVALTAGTYAVGGVTYNYRSAPLRVGVQAGNYAYTISSTDGAGQHTRTGLAAVVAGQRSVTTAWLTGFEHGLLTTPDLFSNVTGGVSIVTTSVRTGQYSQSVTKSSGSTSYIGKNGTFSTVAMTFALRFVSLPTADVVSVASVGATSNPLFVGYQAATKQFTLRWGANPPAVATPVVDTNGWYTFDLKADLNSGTNTAAWRIDGVEQPSPEPLVTTSRTANGVVFGSTTNNDAFLARYDDIVLSAAASDYPLGPTRVLPLRPDGMGTHSNVAHFQQQDGSAIASTTWNRLDEVPMSSIADGVRQVTASSSSYLELTIEDTSEVCIRGVQAVVSQHKTASQANHMKTVLLNVGGEQSLFAGDSGGVNTAVQKTLAILPVVTNDDGWTQAQLNLARFRLGYSADVSPQPYWDSLLVEYATSG